MAKFRLGDCRPLVPNTRITSTGKSMSPPNVTAGATLTSGAGQGKASAHSIGMLCAIHIRFHIEDVLLQNAEQA